MSLAPEEIQLRMTELRNLRNPHTAQKICIGKLEAQVRVLKKENALLREENIILKTEIGDFKLQMEELRTIVFGKKRREKDDDVPPSSPAPRTPESY